MRNVIGSVMLANALLFVFGALQHAGFAFGSFQEPRIVPAAIVEGLCALALVWGTAAMFTPRIHWGRAALVGNLVALGGVLLGMVALALAT